MMKCERTYLAIESLTFKAIALNTLSPYPILEIAYRQEIEEFNYVLDG
jgi:hypothetical protein